MMRLLFLTVLVSSCVTTLKPDLVMPPIKAGYPTAEIRACDKTWHGLAVCALPKGKGFAEIAASVRVYNRGTVSAFSKDCGVEFEATYDKSGLVPIVIPGVIEKNCLLTITVSPTFPGQTEQVISVSSLQGHLAIRMRTIKDSEWKGLTRKVADGSSVPVKFWVGGEKEVHLVADGCGRLRPLDKNISIKNGFLELPLTDLVGSLSPMKTCVATGFISSDFPDLFFDILIARYDKSFRPLPIPKVDINNGSLEVIADEATSVLSFNDEEALRNKATFSSFNPATVATIRAMTVSGRTAIGDWSPEKKEWSWKN